MSLLLDTHVLLAQALEENLALVSKDQYASQYGVRTVW